MHRLESLIGFDLLDISGESYIFETLNLWAYCRPGEVYSHLLGLLGSAFDDHRKCRFGCATKLNTIRQPQCSRQTRNKNLDHVFRSDQNQRVK